MAVWLCDIYPSEMGTRSPWWVQNYKSIALSFASLHSPSWILTPMYRSRPVPDIHSGNSSHDQPESSAGDFLPHAHCVTIRDSTLIDVRGNLILYTGRTGEQPSPVCTRNQSISSQTLIATQWPTYWWTDFDQGTLRKLAGSPAKPGIWTIEMAPMEQTRVKVYRIHQYREKEDIYNHHLAIVKSSCVSSFA